MEIKIFRKNALVNLKENISENLGKYTQPEKWVDDYFASQGMENYARPTGIILPEIKLLMGGAETDGENAIRVYEAMKEYVNPLMASDERFWAYLAHVDFYDYMKERWAITKADETDETNSKQSQNDTLCSRVKSRYFFGASNGKAFVRQGIARLYWSAKLTYDETNLNHYELTEFILSKQDILVAATERLLGRSHNLLLAALRVLKNSGKVSREDTRRYFAEINRAGGVTVLDALSFQNAQDLCEKCMETVRNLPVVQEGDIIKVQYDNSNKVLDFVVDHGRIYFGKTLFTTSPKKITGKKIGEKFTIRKDKVKIIAINGK